MENLFNKMINRFGYRHVRWAMIAITTVLTIAFVATIFMTVKTYHDMNTWVSFTMN